MEGYVKEWEIFQERYRPIFFFLIYLSLIVTLILYYSFVTVPNVTKQMVSMLTNSLGDKGLLKEESALALTFKLFKHNSIVAFHAVWTGFIPVIIIPIVLISGTMMSVSAILAYSQFTGHKPSHMLLLGILPHGIFELPALIYAATVGVYASIETAKYFFLKRKLDFSERQLLTMCIGSYIRVVIPLLLIAAIIEGYVTPLLLRL